LEKVCSIIAANCANDDFKTSLGKPKKSLLTKVEIEEWKKQFSIWNQTKQKKNNQIRKKNYINIA